MRERIHALGGSFIIESAPARGTTLLIIFPIQNRTAEGSKSYKTIANTCGQLKSKLGVHSLPELMRMAIQYLPSMPGKSIKDD